MAKFYFLTGFNGSQPELEDNMIEYLKGKGIEIDRIPYYDFYKGADSGELIRGVTNRIIKEYYKNGCEPLNLIGWSLGGAILTEVLNNISILNEQLSQQSGYSYNEEDFEKEFDKRIKIWEKYQGFKDEIARQEKIKSELRRKSDGFQEQLSFLEYDQPIQIGKVILFSPAWHIIDPKNYLRSHVDPNFYETDDAKEINTATEGKAPFYLLKHPLALWHLFRISTFSRQMTKYINNPDRDPDGGISVLSKYDTTLIIPKNDAYVNVGKTIAEAEKAGIKTVMIGGYGHLAPVVEDAVKESMQELRR